MAQGYGIWLRVCALLAVSALATGCAADLARVAPSSVTHLQRAKTFLAAGDYRRAVEACRQEVMDRPSAETYSYLTYVYHALDAYADALAKADNWVAMELLYMSLATGKPEDLVDPPDVLARIAKELIQQAAQKQADVTAAMATKLDQAATARIWAQQTAWRKSKPDGWWFGIPPEWTW